MIVKRQNKPNNSHEIAKMPISSENGGLKAKFGAMPAENAPAVIQTTAATAPTIFILDETMLKGTKRCVRSLQRNRSQVNK